MKKTILFFTLLFPITSFTQNKRPEISEFEKRIEAIDEFKKIDHPRIENFIQQTIDEITSYKNDKLLQNDEKQRELQLKKMDALKKDFEDAKAVLSSEGSKTILKNLKEAQAKRDEYTNAEKTVKNLENERNISGNLAKFYQLQKEAKYGRSKIYYALLNMDEKAKADKFEKNLNFTIVEEGLQKGLVDQIIKLKKDLNYSLSFPEGSVSKTRTVENEVNKTRSSFLALTDEVETSIQFDYTLPSVWNLGMFECDPKKNPRYLRFKHYPDLLVLDQEGAYNAVIKLDANNPKKLNVVYKCQELGSFGACLDNKEKKLCRLAADCHESLSLAENLYQRNNFFKAAQNALPQELIQERKSFMQKPTTVTLVSEYARLGRLGFYTLSELYGLMDTFSEKIKNISLSTPETYRVKAKEELKALERKEKERLKKLPGFVEGSEKAKSSSELLSYMISSLDSEIENATENDNIQDHIFKHCSQYPVATEFCAPYGEFKTKVTRFNATESITNFTPDECPRVVFRFKDPQGNEDMNQCSPLGPAGEQTFEKLNKEIEAILKN